MKRGKPLERRTELARTEMKRVATLTGSRSGAYLADMESVKPGRTAVAPKRRAISTCTPAQRKRARAMGCVVTGEMEGVDPLHLIPRGMTTVGQDEPLAVVGCRRDIHRLYDDGKFDLLPYLTGRHDDAVAFAVQRVGLIAALERITNARWAEVSE